jgi:hypothetical protein
VSDEWKVPMHPEQRAADALRRRKHTWRTVGGLIGFLANAAALVMLAVQWDSDESTQQLTGGFAVLLLSAGLSLVLLITGGLLCISRRLRPFGVGLLIGTGVGLICTNGVCFTILDAAS